MVIAFCLYFFVSFSIQQQVLVPGRCVAASISDGNNSFSVVNTHNHALTRVQVQDIGLHLSSIAAKVRDDPSKQFAILTGDFNFKADFEKTLKVGRSFESSAAPPANPIGLIMGP